MTRYAPFILGFAASHAFGQGTAVDSLRVTTPAESFLEESVTNEESIAATALQEFLDHPVDVNEATEETLDKLPEMSFSLAGRIVAEARKKRFATVNDLLRVEGMTSDLLESIRPFIRVGGESPGPGSKNFGGAIRTRAQKNSQKAFSSLKARGSPLKLYNRLELQTLFSGLEIRSVFLNEKDPGEEMSASFSSGSILMTWGVHAGSVLLGDFALESGCGIVFWRSSQQAKGPDVAAPGRTRGTRIIPYRSTDENRFFRGIAFQQKLPVGSLTAFASRRFLNGSVSGDGRLTSLDASGLFRTESELRKRNVCREDVLGGALSVTPFGGFSVTLKGYQSWFSLPLELSRFKAFKEVRASVVGVDVSAAAPSALLAAEAARDGHGSIAASGSLALEPSSSMRVIILQRYYPESFNGLHGSGFSESDPMEGEQGLYGGLSARIGRNVRCSFFTDMFRLAASPFASEGSDLFLHTDWRVGSGSSLALQCRTKTFSSFETRSVQRPSGSAEGLSGQLRCRATLTLAPSPVVRWQSRIEFTRVRDILQRMESGYLFYQDLQWIPLRGLMIASRTTVYSTDSYAARLYEVEQDLQGASSLVSLWGSGIRANLVLKYSPKRGYGLSLKWTRTFSESTLPMGETSGSFTAQADIIW